MGVAAARGAIIAHLAKDLLRRRWGIYSRALGRAHLGETFAATVAVDGFGSHTDLAPVHARQAGRTDGFERDLVMR